MILFSEADIARRVTDVAREIAPLAPEIAVPVLNGAFVFAADLVRALAREGVSLPVEFIRLKSYEAREGADAVAVLAGPGEAVRGRKVLLIDGVLDRGATVAKARALLAEAGAAGITTVVAVDKSRADAVARADFALFRGVSAFIVGYGMDDTGRDRGLPHIAAV